MAYVFTLPDLGEGIVQATILRWHVEAGDQVSEGDPLVDVETDKTVSEIPAPATGRVGRVEAREGQTIGVGEPLVTIETASEPAGHDRAARVRIAPRARRLANELGVEVEPLARELGRPLTEGDILAASEGRASLDAPERGVPAQSVRRTLAGHLTRVQQEVPAVTVVEECDFTELERIATGYERTALILKAVSAALRDVPELNATLLDDAVVVHERHDIGVAMQGKGGLIVGVVRDVDRRSKASLSDDARHLSEAALAGRLRPEEVRDSTFTITDAGRLGGVLATPLVNAPNIAILGVHRAADRPTVRDGELTVRRMGNVSCTFDHRAVDGFQAGTFLLRCIELLERPEALPPDGASLPGAGEARPVALELAALPEDAREAAALRLVCVHTAAVLDHSSPASIDPQRAFKELGFNSLGAVKLRNRLAEATGLTLPSTLAFDHPSPQAVAALLCAAVVGGRSPRPALARAVAPVDEPIAIVGMGCRFPGGVRSPQELWELVERGADAIGPFPRDRGWELERLIDTGRERRGTTYVREAGFLEGAAEFDPAFFGIGPHEALAMDPQQRLLLLIAWEALEHAGIDPTVLRGSATGVFAGLIDNRYGHGRTSDGLDGLRLTGATASVASGRVAYALGLEGPAVSIDTACSSSLVAIHYACRSLRSGECSLALAGGATVLATPEMFVEFSHQDGLASDGRCKSFAAAADGTGWSEGAGLLVLERLSDARRLEHRVLGLIRGSAINQDGASNGLTAPNGPSQARVIAQALADAGLSPAEVDAVEAHGTGTTLGDPIEAQAVLATYGRERTAPLRLGSVKSNLGHTQAAAGVGGVIKIVEALRHGTLPATLHVDAPTPHVDWDAGRVELLTEAVEWLPRPGRSRRAGVSSFGISGTNAHVILEEAPAEDAVAVAATGLSGVVAWVVSGRDAGALRRQAAGLLEHLKAHEELSLVDVAHSLAGRAQMQHAAVVLGRDRDELLGGLRAVVRGERSATVVTGVAGRPGRVGFMFTGQGSQRPGMGRELHEAFPVFARSLDAICAKFDRVLERPLRDVMFAAEDSDEARLLDDTAYTQPALFAFERALAELLAWVGIRPEWLIGHSVGELVAAHVAGVFSSTDACALVSARGRLMRALPPGGAMVALSADEQTVRGLLAGFEARLEVAAVNSSRSVVVSGDEQALAEWTEQLGEGAPRTTRLKVGHAFHSQLIEPALDELRAVAGGLSSGEPKLPVVSNVTGEPAGEEIRSADYWAQQARMPVRFLDGLRCLAGAGVSHLVEIGPDAVLSGFARQALDDELPVVATQRGRGSEEARLFAALARLHVSGARVDWRALLAAHAPRAVELPTYAFERERYWLAPSAAGAEPGALGLDDAHHPLLGGAVTLADGDGLVLTGRISLAAHVWLADHRVLDRVVVAGTAFVDMALHAARSAGCELVEELTLESPLVLEHDSAMQIQLLVAGPSVEGKREFSIHARPTHVPDSVWTRHASGVLAPGDAGVEGVLEQLAQESWPPVGADALDVEGLYDQLAQAGFVYGPAFRGVRRAWRRGEEIFAEVAADAQHEFVVHPAVLDATLHAWLAGRVVDGLMLPFAWRGVRVGEQAGAGPLRVRLAPVGANGLGVAAIDANGVSVVSIAELIARASDPAQLRAAGVGQDLYELTWVPLTPLPGAQASIAVLGDEPLTFPGQRYADVEELGAAVAAGAPVPEVVIAPLVADAAERGPALVDAAHTMVLASLSLLQSWIATPNLQAARLAVVTRGAVATNEGAEPLPAAATAWGLVRSAQAEHPGRIVLVDLDDDPASAAALAAVLASDAAQVAVRAGSPLVPRLERAQAIPVVVPLAPGGTVLVTGGTGGLGALVARHLVESHQVARIVLVSRRGEHAPTARALQEELAAKGADVRIVAADVSDRAQVAQLLDSLEGLTAVVHAAGALDDAAIESMDGERLRHVLAPKLDAAVWLDELTAGSELTAFVLFSSVAGVLGSPGQANYAAANAFLDALAQARRARGLPATSLAWGLWELGTGMTAELDALDVARIERLGIKPLASAHGLALLDAALTVDQPLVVPAVLDRSALREQARAGALPAPLQGLVPRTVEPVGAFARRLASVPGDRRDELVLELVRGEVAAALGLTTVGAEQPFAELGLDSLGAVELRNRLAAETGVRLPATLVFDHPTPAAVATVLRSLAEGQAPRTRTLTAAPARLDEPIAIVGAGCRYPGGVRSPEDLWQMVAAGLDAISEFPHDRGWDLEALLDPDTDRPGTSVARGGGFLHDAADFDSSFFGIGPREALAMDPQHRLLLEVAWEALEHAGIDPTTLRGSATGVFAGIMYHDYGSGSGSSELEGLRLVGTLGSVASGRVAYALGLEGPAVSIDTACSSSLVAIHLACDALRRGECSFALAGGATVMATPAPFIELSRQGGLARDGRCKSFAARADGTAWSEGVGLVALERLSDARRLDHRILAVVRGSAVNQDGTSNGLTAPNGPSQERVIMQALAGAGLSPADVDAVEAHGTGTKLGDPIEAKALLAVYGADRSEPLRVGSIKSNLGHTQAAAGVAGVIKMVQALRHGELPRTLHVDAPSPHVDWDAGRVELLTEAVEWAARRGRARRAGVSSFGISGTNAHVILEEVSVEHEHATDGELLPLVLSARTDASLRAQAARLRAHVLDNPELSVGDVAYTLAVGRAQFDHRAVIIAADRARLLVGLEALADDRMSPDVITDVASGAREPVFVFPGQGAQWEGMAVELLDAAPAFARSLRACQGALSQHVDWSLEDVLRGVDGAPSIDRVDVVQPTLFALMVSLSALWRTHGVIPAAVLGHSQGEIAAAHVAGALSLEDAVRIVARRSQALTALSGLGGMMHVSCSPDELAGRLEGWQERVGIAAFNGPGSMVVSGDPEALDELLQVCELDDVRARRIPVDYASHSPQVEALRGRLRKELGSVQARAGAVPICSTVTGGSIDGAELSGEHWYRGLRQPVLFEQATRSLIDGGARAFIEVSPHPVLIAAVEETAEACGNDPVLGIGSLRRDEGGPERFLRSLAQAHVGGVHVDWNEVFVGARRERVELPTYAFQRERFWLAPDDGGTANLAEVGLEDAEHPWLAAKVRLGNGRGWVFTGRLTLDTSPWLADHAVLGTPIVPATGLVELVSRAAAEIGPAVIEELTFQVPLALAEGAGVEIQVLLQDSDGADRHDVQVHARADGEEDWTLHASATVVAAEAEALELEDSWPPAGAQELPVDDLYERLADLGYGYGPAFQLVRAAWHRGEEVFVECALDDASADDRFMLHPALLDSALQPWVLGGDLRLPFSWTGVRRNVRQTLSLRTRMTPTEDGVVIRTTDSAGRPVLSVDAGVLRPFDVAGLAQGGDLFEIAWREIELQQSESTTAQVAVLGGGLRGVPGPRYEDLDALEQDASSLELVLTRAETPNEVLGLLQAWIRSDALSGARLGLVTEHGMAVAPGEAPEAEMAAVWGLVRSAQSEHPDRFLLVDSDGSVHACATLPTTLADAASRGESQLAVRGSGALAPRIVDPTGSETLEPPMENGSWRLVTDEPGTFERLRLVGFGEGSRPLEAGEVRVGLRAAGLNFRDVLLALGAIPSGVDSDAIPLGFEGAGVVLEVGREVDDLAVGDRVMGVMRGAFATMAVTDRAALARIPAGWSFTEAASVPIAFVTAYYGLVELGGLQRGERVLIHAAAGGVGMAAVQIARHLGAEVFATAHPDKWSALRAYGLDDGHIASSRTVEFKDTVMAATGGHGVDVVLNSLAGEFIDASLESLGSGGRFIEMGVVAIRSADGLPAGTDYRVLDLREVAADANGRMLSAVLELFERSALALLPLTIWDVRDAVPALRHLSQGRHVGKLVFTIPTPLDPGGTVLVTGGTTGLGALVARWLVAEHGIRHLVLVSRRGKDTPGVSEVVEDLVAAGANVHVAACDVSDREQVAGLLADIPAAQPLTGVFHAATILDDATIESLDPAGLERVMAVKARAARHLHELTLGLDLSSFVLFSSASGLFGMPGQGNYAAANTFVDALAQYRRARGLPGISLALGHWAETTGATGGLRDQDMARMARLGVLPLATADGIALIGRALHRNAPVSVPARLDRAALRRLAGTGDLAPLLREIAGPVARALDHGTSSTLADLPPDERADAVLALVRSQCAAVLGHDDGATIVVDRAFKELGIDSLGAVELRNRLARATGLRLKSTVVFDHPRPELLAAHLCDRFGAGTATQQPPFEAEFDRLEAMLAQVAVENGDRERFGERLRTFAARAQELLDETSEPTTDGTDFATLSDTEMLELIDRELEGR